MRERIRASKYNNVTNGRASAQRRTGERAENAMTVDIRGGVEKCINVVKYNKKGEKGRESVAAAVRCVGESWERGESAGILSSSISVAGESACSSTHSCQQCAATCTRSRLSFVDYNWPRRNGGCRASADVMGDRSVFSESYERCASSNKEI